MHNDLFYWVEEFEATHPVYGRVFGDFGCEVMADSEEGFNDFFEKHAPYAWDFQDI